MKKLLLALLCATGISASYAAGLFDVIGSTLNTITGNNSGSSSSSSTNSSDNDANGGINSDDKVTVTEADGGWKIYKFEDQAPGNINKCSEG